MGLIHFLGSIPTEELHSANLNIISSSRGMNYFSLFLLILHTLYGSAFSAFRLQLLVVVFPPLRMKIDEEINVCHFCMRIH